MVCDDVKVAVFFSPHMFGDVRVEYCSHQQMYVLRYRAGGGVWSYCCYDVTKPSEVRDLLLDAVDIAGKPLKDRC